MTVAQAFHWFDAAEALAEIAPRAAARRRARAWCGTSATTPVPWVGRARPRSSAGTRARSRRTTQRRGLGGRWSPRAGGFTPLAARERSGTSRTLDADAAARPGRVDQLHRRPARRRREPACSTEVRALVAEAGCPSRSPLPYRTDLYWCTKLRVAALLAWGERAPARPAVAAQPRPWAVLVSELMLQQTQVPRVVPTLRGASSRASRRRPLCRGRAAGDVVRAWAGLGYNRRAVNLHRAAAAIVERHDGRVPDDARRAARPARASGPTRPEPCWCSPSSATSAWSTPTPGASCARRRRPARSPPREAQALADAARARRPRLGVGPGGVRPRRARVPPARARVRALPDRAALRLARRGLARARSRSPGSAGISGAAVDASPAPTARAAAGWSTRCAAGPVAVARRSPTSMGWPDDPAPRPRRVADGARGRRARRRATASELRLPSAADSAVTAREDLVDRGVGEGAASRRRCGPGWDGRRSTCAGSTPSAARLGVGGVDELGGGDEHAGHAPALEIGDVVHTARRARASVGEGFDHHVARRGDLVAQVDGAGLVNVGLRKRSTVRPRSPQQLLEPVEEHVAARLGDVEQADGQAVERRGPGDALAVRRARARRWGRGRRVSLMTRPPR